MSGAHAWTIFLASAGFIHEAFLNTSDTDETAPDKGDLLGQAMIGATVAFALTTAFNALYAALEHNEKDPKLKCY